MALHLISSNRVETLQQTLVAFVRRNPLPHPLTAETVLVPSMPVQRWLGLQWAQHAGIHCNIAYALPASWIWHQLSTNKGGGTPDPLTKDAAAWMIFRLLPNLLQQSPFATLRHYLQHDPDGVGRWQLATRIADRFDRYQYYRPQIIRRWSAGEDEGWQPLLWRELLTIVGHDNHRVALMDRWLAAPAKQLPARISLFCISALPPLLLQLLQHAAAGCDVYLYHLTPTNSYWADLKTEKAKARERLQHNDVTVYDTLGHPLLASWGKQGQIYQDMLLNHDSLQTIEYEQYHTEWPPTLLGVLQRDIFYLTSTPSAQQTMPPDPDSSLEIHICHTPQRECQILHDNLLQRLQQDPSLKPEDILVMVPEISRYAPYITTVFARSTNRPFIPWNISDLTMDDHHPLIAAFLQLLHLPDSRFTCSEILSLLDIPEICQRIALDHDQITRVRQLLDQLQVRWGADDNHRASLGLPATIANSWKQAEQRFLAGYAMGDTELWQGIAPLPQDSSDSAALAAFWSLFTALNQWRIQLQQPRSATAWQESLINMVDELFGHCNEESEQQLQQIRESLAALAQQADDIQLSRELMRHWLESWFAQLQNPHHYFTGGISFCGMHPMRMLPFRVICLLGMQSDAFPRQEHSISFDLMAEKWQPGDPCKGVMDRYLMLETLLCARDALYISYTGRSVHDNSVCQPSVLVDELCDLLQHDYGQAVVDGITHLHPMQPFSPANFVGQKTFDHYWCRLGKAMPLPANEPEQPWPNQKVSAVTLPQEVSLSNLIRFARHPVKFFVNQTLNLYLQEETEPRDEEPFALDALELWQIKHRLLQAEQGHDTSQYLEAEGRLPPPPFGTVLLQEQQNQVTPLLEAIARIASPPAISQPFTFVHTATDHGDQQITVRGSISHYYPETGIVHVSPSAAKGKHLIALWIEHLALCSCQRLADHEASRLIALDGTTLFTSIPADDAKKLLAQIVDTYLQGIQQPLPLFPNASWNYIAANSSAAKKDPVKEAHRGWDQGRQERGDRYDPYIALMTRGANGAAVDDPAFAHWSKQLYQPVYDAAQREEADDNT